MHPGGPRVAGPTPTQQTEGAGTVVAKGLAGVDAHSPCRGADCLLREELCPPLGAKTAADGQTDAPDKGLRQNERSTRRGWCLASSSQRLLLLGFPVGSEGPAGVGTTQDSRQSQGDSTDGTEDTEGSARTEPLPGVAVASGVARRPWELGRHSIQVPRKGARGGAPSCSPEDLALSETLRHIGLSCLRDN